MLSEKEKKALQKLGVSAVYLFGSLLEGRQRGESDVDIAVLLETSRFHGDVLQLYDQLYVLFSNVFAGKEIDVVFLRRVPLTVQFEIVTSGKVIYSSPPERLYSFKERIVKQYIDFQPLLEEQNRLLLERL